MEARIDRGKIYIGFGDEDQVPDGHVTRRELVLATIGSAHEVEEHPTWLTCALSVPNFRKLKSLGCKLTTDSHTRSTVAALKASHDTYLEESVRGDAVKAGEEIYKNYKFKIPPFKHQLLGFQFLHSMSAPALFGDCGTGKTFLVATYADSIIKAGEDFAFIVICPVNLIEHVWLTDVAKFTDLTALNLRLGGQPSIREGDWEKDADRSQKSVRKKALARAKARRHKSLKEHFGQTSNVYVLNYEQLRLEPMRKLVVALCKRLVEEGKQVCLVLDESSKFKSRTSATYRALRIVRSHCARCIIMTGTPSPNGILDLWAQFSVLDGGLTLHPHFSDYRAEVAKEVELRGVTWIDKQGMKRTAKTWVPKPGKALEVHRTIKPRVIRFRTDDCIDLPPVRCLTRDVAMNDAQTEAYEDMEGRLFTELEGEPVTARIAVTKLLKLREITGGFLVTDQRREVPLGKDSPKMVELDTLLEQSIADQLGDEGPPRKALVWAQYRWECRTLIERYSRSYGARGLYGDVSLSGRNESIRRFKEDRNCRILVCHPGSAGHGLNLTEASFAFYYSLDYSYENTYQSFRRMARPGQKRQMTNYFLICPGTIDEDILEALAKKRDLSDLLTDGSFNRDSFLARRGQNREVQMDLTWEVPDDSSASIQPTPSGPHPHQAALRDPHH